MEMVKCLPEFEYFTVFLKNRNFISKIRISKVTDYAALSIMPSSVCCLLVFLNCLYGKQCEPRSDVCLYAVR